MISGASAPFEIRELATAAEYAACVELQKETWGRDFTECVPAALLRVTQKIGGIAAGAFANNELIGFVFGMTGVHGRQPVHWSDMLAVRASHRDRGIGEALKRYQRETLLQRGVNRVYWTFDPLDAKNAYLNFVRLGVYAREYAVDMYGTTESPLHAGIGTDRLVVTWDLTSRRVMSRLQNQRATEGSESGHIRIKVPLDIHAINRADPARAREWREQTRAAFLNYLPQYVVSDFAKEEDAGYYALTSASSFSM